MFCITRLSPTRGVLAGDWEGLYVRIESLVTTEVADSILEGLNASFFEEYAVIAWLTEVNVLRGVKLISEPPFSNDSDN